MVTSIGGQSIKALIIELARATSLRLGNQRRTIRGVEGLKPHMAIRAVELYFEHRRYD